MKRGLMAAAALALSLCPAAPARAEEPATRVMTLSEAIAWARAHQPSVRAAMARVAAQEQEARIPRAQWLPSIGVTAQIFGATANNTTGTYVNAPFVDLVRIGGTSANASRSMRPYASTLVGAGVEQEVFDFGRIAAQSAAADALVDVARRRAASEQLDVDFSIEEAYFAVYAAKSVMRASDEAYERAKVHRDLAKAGVTSGLRSPVELTRAEADLSRFDIGRERARAGVLVAQSVLAATVGVPDPALDVAAAPPDTKEMPTFSEAVREAASRDPRILEAEARVRAQEQTTRAIGAELRPNLALTSSLSVRAGGAPAGMNNVLTGDGFAPSIPNWDVGLVLTWPLFHGPTLAREKASRAREQVAREELAAMKFQRSAAVQQAYVAFTVARAALPGLTRAVEAARANYDQAEARFKSGLGNAVELADAEALRTQAEIELALGRFELSRARVAFGKAIAEEP